MKVLFICTGNTCRSPMAEKLLLKKAKEKNLQIEVMSAGIAAAKGRPASKHARTVMSDYGIPEEHQSKQVTEELLSWADLILTMTIGHKRVLIEQNPTLYEKIFTFNEYILNQGDIIDPFGKDLITYKKTAEELSEGLEHLLKMLFI